jgi:acetate kinase
VLGDGITGCVGTDRGGRSSAALRRSAPAHNPPYAGAGASARTAARPRVALLNRLYQWVPEYANRYAVPDARYQVACVGMAFTARATIVPSRSAELLDATTRRSGPPALRDGPDHAGRPLRVISCHLGGSSSVSESATAWPSAPTWTQSAVRSAAEQPGRRSRFRRHSRCAEAPYRRGTSSAS